MKDNPDFFSRFLQNHFAKILKNNLETVVKKILKKSPDLEFFKIGGLGNDRTIDQSMQR